MNIIIRVKIAFLPLSVVALLFGLITTSLSARPILPEGPFPIGSPDLVETRSIRQLRLGLTHVHIERSGKASPPKLSFFSGMLSEKDEETQGKLSQFKEFFKGKGFPVREHRFQPYPESDPYIILLAGEFEDSDEANKIRQKLNSPFYFATTNPIEYPYWEGGPYALDIVILDPKIYRGKMVSAWSERPWKASPMELALRDNAVVATNAGFFEEMVGTVAGVPSGISIVQGRWHSEHYPEENKAAILFIENTQEGPVVSIGYKPPPFPEIKYKGENIKLDGIDRFPSDNQITVMTLDFMRRSSVSHSGFSGVTYQITPDGFFREGYSNRGGLMVLASGDKEDVLRGMLGQKVEVDLNVPGRPGLNAFYVTPVYAQDGEFTPGIETLGARPRQGLLRRTERTLIGADAEGKIYLMVTNGPREGTGFDTTVYGPMGTNDMEAQAIVRHLGLINAANFDGGGSSTSMVIEGKRVDSPYITVGTEDRRVSDSVLIIDDQ